VKFQQRYLYGNVKAEWTNVDEDDLPFGIYYNLAGRDCSKITISYKNSKHQFRKVEE
jgi:hypothetical protein